MKTVVFAGPSIFGVERARFDGIEFRPPAACGDILLAISDGATSIGLIDGYYGDQIAVCTKRSCSPCRVELQWPVRPVWVRFVLRNVRSSA